MAGSFHDKIAKLCIDHFNSLTKAGKPTATQWTVLSCIVKQNGPGDDFDVVSLGTGSKCIGRSQMSPAGDILNDSHAEVVCRRAFLRYLYEQINSTDGDVFTFNPDNSKYRLKDSITFHFFTTHVPCGDAAIFPKQSLEEFGELVGEDLRGGKRRADCDLGDEACGKRLRLVLDASSLESSGDICRTGAKCLPTESRQDLHSSGPQYHTLGAVRTKPGRGNPTLSVSCSDKIAKWGHLGVQGALLSQLIEAPVYLSSFTMAGGTLYNERSLRRSLYDRFDALHLRLPYRTHEMKLGQASTCFEHAKANSKQACPSSIAWCRVKTRACEVSVEGKKQGVTKKNRGTKAGRLLISKVELFRTFLATMERLKGCRLEDVSKLCYHEAKSKAREYREMWEVLKSEGFKVWTVKDEALLRFVVD